MLGLSVNFQLKVQHFDKLVPNEYPYEHFSEAFPKSQKFRNHLYDPSKIMFGMVDPDQAFKKEA